VPGGQTGNKVTGRLGRDVRSPSTSLRDVTQGHVAPLSIYLLPAPLSGAGWSAVRGDAGVPQSTVGVQPVEHADGYSSAAAAAPAPAADPWPDGGPYARVGWASFHNFPVTL
jgi:hypothetical protein